jgi:hypothetical protein
VKSGLLIEEIRHGCELEMSVAGVPANQGSQTLIHPTTTREAKPA